MVSAWSAEKARDPRAREKGPGPLASTANLAWPQAWKQV